MPMGVDKPGHERPATQIHHLCVISDQGQHCLRTPHGFYHPVAHAHRLNDVVFRIHSQDRAVNVDFVLWGRDGTRDDRDEHSETAQ